MRDILVAVDFVSSDLSLAELGRIVGCDATEGSFDRQQRGPAGKARAYSRLRVSSDVPTADIAQQLEVIAAKLNDVMPNELAQKDIVVYLDVAVFTTDAMASLQLMTHSLDELPIRPTAIEISFYPCTD